MKTILTIAGSDSGGGAGIQADLKTITMLNEYGASIITAVTAQNTCEVLKSFPVPGEILEAQFDAVFGDLQVSAAKTGMLFDANTAAIVAKKIKEYSCPHLVVDPVMISTSGSVLLEDGAIRTIWDEVFPLAEVITPNLHETERLTGRAVTTLDEMKQAGEWIRRECGCGNVLIKGGHLNGHPVDVLCAADGTAYYYEGKRVETKNTHGTGCTLSAAIATFLGKGQRVESAVFAAKQYLTGALEAGRYDEIGRGHGPVRHNYLLHGLSGQQGDEMYAVKRDGGVWINPINREQ